MAEQEKLHIKLNVYDTELSVRVAVEGLRNLIKEDLKTIYEICLEIYEE